MRKSEERRRDASCASLLFTSRPFLWFLGNDPQPKDPLRQTAEIMPPGEGVLNAGVKVLISRVAETEATEDGETKTNRVTG